MKKLQLFVYLLFISVVVISCGDDNEEQPAPKPTNCALTKFTTTGLYADSYTYTNGRVTTRKVEINGGSSYNYTYEYDVQGRITKENRYDGVSSSSLLISYVTFTYQSATVIIAKKSNRQNDGSYVQETATTTYEFDSNGQILKSSYGTSQSVLSYNRYEYNSNGNVTKEYIKTGASPEYLKTEYTKYDDKIQPFRQLPSIAFLFSDLGNLSKNNFTEVKLYNSSGVLQETTIFTYQYNELGYPTNIGNGGITYQYNCQ